MRRPLRIAGWSIGALLLLVLLLIGVVLIAGNTRWGRSTIEALTARLTGGTVRITGLAGSFPSHLSLAKLQLKDDRGIWLSGEQVNIDWNPWVYFSAGIAVNNLHAAQLDVQRLPHKDAAAPGNGDVSIPRIDVARLSIDRASVGPELAGTAATLEVAGSAHLRSLSDMRFDAHARRLDGDGEYTVRAAFDAKQLDAALQVHETANGPLENILTLPGLGGLSVTGTFSGPRNAEKLQLTLQAGAMRGHAEGSFDLSDLSSDITFAFEAPGMQPRDDVRWSHASLAGHWRGTVKQPDAAAHLEVDALTVPGGTNINSLRADLQAGRGAATLLATVSGLEIPGPAPRLLAADPIKINAAMQLDQEQRPLTLSASQRLFELQARIQTAGRQGATLELRLPQLAPFAALLGEQQRGSATLNARIGYSAAQSQLRLNGAFNLDHGTQPWSGLLGEHAVLELAGTLSDKDLVIEALKLTGRAAALDVKGDLTRAAPRLRLSFGFDVSDLSALSTTLAGKFRSSGSLQGPLTALSGDAQAVSTLSVRGAQSGEISARAKFQGLPSAPAGSLSAEGLLDGAPLHADVAIDRSAAGVLHTVIRGISWKSAHAQGDITTSGSQVAHGQLHAQMSDLSDMQHLLGAQIGGSVSADIDLHPERERTRMHIKLDAQDISYASLLGSAQLTGDGVTDAFPFEAHLQIPKLNGGPAKFDLAGLLNADARHVQLSRVLADYHGQDLRLGAPAHIDFANGLAVDGLHLTAQQARLDVRGRVSPELDLRLALTGVQPDLVNAFLPNLLREGSIEANAELHGELHSPTGRVELNADKIRMGDDSALGLPPADLHAHAQLQGETAKFDARLTAGNDSQLQADGRVPLALSGSLDVKLMGKVAVGLLNPILEARGQHAEGELAIDATVTGAAAAPQIGGSIHLTGGALRDYSQGVSLNNITAEFVGGEGALQIKSFTASAPPGTLSMTGTIGVLQPHIPVDLKISAQNAQPIASKLVTANLNADLHVSGTAREHLAIAGKVHLNRTVIGIPNSLPPNVAVLDVRRRGAAPPPMVDKPLIVDLDLAVQSPQELLVQGRGLDAEMGGDLHIGGTVNAPLASGGFDLQRGSFSIASSKLSFSTGKVSFAGSGTQRTLIPELDFTAQTNVGDTTVTLHISGAADAPQFEFSSAPALPPDTIMALLLFGSTGSQLSGLQLAQVGAALASLSGVGGNGGLNPLAKIQKTLGLDRLTIGSGTPTSANSTENTGASIEAGRYISKRVYIEAKQNTQGTSQVEADIDLVKGLKLQTKLGNGTASVQGTTLENDPGSSIGLFYQFEY